MNKILSVFNELGNFGGNIDVKAEVTVEELVKLLQPHRLEQSAHAETETYSVRPMNGISITESSFYVLIKQTLASAGVVEGSSELETGYGAFRLKASFNQTNTGYATELVITRESTGEVLLNAGISRGAVTVAEVEEDIHSLVSTATALQKLVSQGAEFITTRLSEYTPPNGRVKTEQPAQVAPKRVNVNEQQQTTRAVVDRAVREVRDAAVKPVLAVLSVLPANRDNAIALVIQLEKQDYEAFVAEGVVTTILNTLPHAVIDAGLLQFGECNGYLRMVRQAMNDHGITPLSLTPREPESLLGDSNNEYIYLL